MKVFPQPIQTKNQGINMIKLLFLLPILMCLFWWQYLKAKDCSLKDGVKGFAYIIGFNTVLIGFFIVMLFATH